MTYRISTSSTQHEFAGKRKALVGYIRRLEVP